jgi:hypothetical protein
MKKKLYIIYVLFLISIISCEFLIPCKDQEFTISKTENTAYNIKLNGFYYDTVLLSNTYSIIYLLYSNGVFYNRNMTDINNINNNNVYFDSKMSNYKTYWGLYIFDNDSIEIQYWGEKYGNCYKIIKQKGIIINDTCFKIVKTTNYHDKWIDDYHFFIFKQYSPKPDSTNSFFD